MNSKILIALLLVIAAAGLGWYFTHRASEQPITAVAAPRPLPAPQPVQREEPPPAASGEPQKPLVAAPVALDNSDAQMRAAATDIAPDLVQWLTPQEQIRKWVALIDEIAEGKLPLQNRPLNYPLTTFMVKRDGDTLTLDKENYPRTTLLIKTVTSISPARLAQYYHAWRPLLDKAYAELGNKGSFDNRVHLAIQRILAVKSLPAEPQLVRPSVYYKYADPKLEAASDIEKLMWRLGPDNTQRIQDYLQQLQREL